MAVDATAVDLTRALVMTPVRLADLLIVAPVALPMIGGALALFLRNMPRLQPLIAILVLAVLVVCEAALLSRVLAEGPLTMMMGRWLPPFGIAFTIDALGAVLALTAGVAGLAVAVYAATDLTAGDRRFGFYPLLLLLVTGVSGAFCTGDVFNLYVWFEVLLISSFGLIVLGGEPRQLDGAVKYGVLNLIATTLFLIGTGYLYGLVGTLNMADITARVTTLPEGGAITTIAMLYLLAFAMKAAAFPLGFWLPASYHTPKIVVGAIFAGLLTKVGVYALIRILAMLMPGERLLLADVITWVAVLTLLVPALAALAESEIRRTLGWVVIAGIGNMLAGLALGSEAGYAGAIAYAVHSMLAMTAIYLTLGLVELNDGFKLLPVLIGLFAVNQVINEVLQLDAKVEKVSIENQRVLPALSDWTRHSVNMIRSALIGTWIGILPGIGANIGSVAAYSTARTVSKKPEEFGHGSEEGIIASESANNATVGGALIPLVSMGIPGSVIDAILLGALVLHGLQPGPLLFKQEPQLIYTIMGTYAVANVAMFLVLVLAVRWIARLVEVPKQFLLPVILTFCVVGSYSLGNRMFDVWVMLAFGLIGFGMERSKIPLAPFVIGFVLGPIAEKNLCEGLMSSGGNYLPLVTRPMSLIFLLISVAMLAIPLAKARRS